MEVPLIIFNRFLEIFALKYGSFGPKIVEKSIFLVALKKCIFCGFPHLFLENVPIVNLGVQVIELLNNRWLIGQNTLANLFTHYSRKNLILTKLLIRGKITVYKLLYFKFFLFTYVIAALSKLFTNFN